MLDQDDSPLRAALAAGREDAFEALYDCYGRPLFRVAWTMLRSRQDAEDAVQEVFLGLVRARSACAKVNSLRAYLFTALRHAVARLAARRKSDTLPTEDLPERESNEGDMDAELSHSLERGLTLLPQEQRVVLTLKIDGGLTFAEVASVLGISANTAASRYRYALKKLRAALDTEHHERAAPTRPA
jgi:RNA polymerase sigma-70 factor (ECF subfamily)